MYAFYDPGLGDHGMDDSGTTSSPCPRPTAVAPSRALVVAPRLTMTSSGSLGTSDGWEDVRGLRLETNHVLLAATSGAPRPALGHDRSLVALGGLPRTLIWERDGAIQWLHLNHTTTAPQRGTNEAWAFPSVCERL